MFFNPRSTFYLLRSKAATHKWARRCTVTWPPRHAALSDNFWHTSQKRSIFADEMHSTTNVPLIILVLAWH